MGDVPARQCNGDTPAPREGYAGFRVRGKDRGLWKKLRGKLVAKVQDVVEQLVEEDAGLNWLQEQAREFGSLAIENARARLRREGVEVEKIEAEIAVLFATKEKIHEEAHKIRAEARAIELDTAIKELKLALGVTKALMIGDDSQEAVLFGRQIDAMLAAIKAVGETEGV